MQSKKTAFQYLSNKLQNGKKGKEIKYTQIEMADYLLPSCSLSVEDKRQMFAIRSETNDLPYNFGKSEICCKTEMNNEHILMCQKLNGGTPFTLKYEKILNGTLREKIAILEQFKINIQKRKTLLNKYAIHAYTHGPVTGSGPSVV